MADQMTDAQALDAIQDLILDYGDSRERMDGSRADNLQRAMVAVNGILADRDALRQEVDRLTKALAEADANHEEFERKFYLAGDECDRLAERLAEADAQAARVADGGGLLRAINRAAEELPDGCVVQVCVEQDAGWVELVTPEGYIVPMDADETSLAGLVEMAIDYAQKRDSKPEDAALRSTTQEAGHVPSA